MKSAVAALVLRLATGLCFAQGEQWLPEFWNEAATVELNKVLAFRENTNVAKNLIFMIGDGMGITTVTAARILKGQQDNKLGEEGYLSWEIFPHIALSKTYNTDATTPDSAGTATAFHYGFKTKYGVIGTDDRVVRGQCATEAAASTSSNLMQLAKMAGKSTGIITTTRITHATPAPLYAKSANRDWESDADLPPDAVGKCPDIAAQFISNGLDIDVVMGGGRVNFMTANQTDPEYPSVRGKRKDGRKLLQEWQDKQDKANKNCRYVWNQTEFDQVTDSVGCLLALFEPSSMLYEDQRNATLGNEPSLTQMVEKAIRILRRNPKGFYLFVEGARIDHGHHDNLARYALTETVELHRAVEKASSMTSTSDTLIVVSADHSHVFTLGGYARRGTPILGLVANVEEGYDNALDGKPYTSLAYGNGPGYKEGGRQNLTGVKTDEQGYVFQSAVPFASESHGGEDVAIYANGPMSHLFHGVQEQSYIPHAMAYAACIGADKRHCSTSKSYSIAAMSPSGYNTLAMLILSLYTLNYL